MVDAGGTLRGCGDLQGGSNPWWALIRDVAARPCSVFTHCPSQATDTSTFPPKAPLGGETRGAELWGHSVGVHPGFSRRRILANRADTPRDCGPCVEPLDSCLLLGCIQGQSCSCSPLLLPSCSGTPTPQQAPALSCSPAESWWVPFSVPVCLAPVGLGWAPGTRFPFRPLISTHHALHPLPLFHTDPN